MEVPGGPPVAGPLKNHKFETLSFQSEWACWLLGLFWKLRKSSMLGANLNLGHIGDRNRWRAWEEGPLRMLNEKGFREGGAIPNTRSYIRSLASFQL